MYYNFALLTSGVIANAGKKFVEVALPALKQASLVSLKVIQDEVFKSDTAPQVENIKLTQAVDIVDNNLNIPASFSDNQLKSFEEKISSGLNVIKGQNEIIFLSNSIAYFVQSHAQRTGLDRSISYALQYDISAVREHLRNNREIRFPGYLLHQCSSLAETVKDLNIFYTAVLAHGVVPNYTADYVEQEINRRFGASQRQGGFKSYIPYDLQLPALRVVAEKKQTRKQYF